MKVAIIGGGLTGMSAAHVLSQQGVECTIFEGDGGLGGLAASFDINGARLEKFYRHLFTSDTAIVGLIEELGLGDKMEWKASVTSLYAHGCIYRLSTPMDVLRFTPLSFFDRIRLGMLAIWPRFVRDWKPLEGITAREWLIHMAGQRVYDVVWGPLMRAKFGSYADQVAAVWFWNKLKLRGGSRSKEQSEQLGYLRGGFWQLVESLEERLRGQGVEIRLSTPVEGIRVEEGRATGVVAKGQFIPYDRVLVTAAPEAMLKITPGLPPDYAERLGKIEYLANTCLVMILNRSLSSTYWLNIGDTDVPFVAVIEHTNFRPRSEYGGRHLAYLSRYMTADDPYYAMTPQELFQAYLPHLRKMFPEFSADWVETLYAWSARHTQPVIVRHYSGLRPSLRTPVTDLWLSCMASIYPEDRGMNYAVAYGQRVAEEMLSDLGDESRSD